MMNTGIGSCAAQRGLLALLLCGLLACAPLQAQDETPDAESAGELSEPAEDADVLDESDVEADDTDDAERRSPDTFRPSEEIWADTAISFPADI